MTMVPNTAASIAAAKQAEQMREEEDRMTTYSPEYLEKYEFKILRSSMGSFGNPTVLQQVLQEEAQSGWELVEKFDSNRLRFKRKITERDRDVNREIDPYRTNYGMGEGALVLGLILFPIALIFIIGMLALALN